jgi:hypothetical protein
LWNGSLHERLIAVQFRAWSAGQAGLRSEQRQWQLERQFWPQWPSNGVMGVGGILNKRRPKTGNFLSERGRASEHLGPSVVNTLLLAQVPTQASLDM